MTRGRVSTDLRAAILAAVLIPAVPAGAGETDLFTIARLQYDGGGDWYSDPSSLPNLLAFLQRHTRLRTASAEARVSLLDRDLFAYPYLYMTGHGNVSWTQEEAARLRTYLEAGGFLHADDNYGMDESFRREMGKLFPTRELVELPASHELFRCHFELPDGLPKVHEHDGGRPQALGLFGGDRLLVLYTYESDLGDGWEDAHVHGDSEEVRQQALRMGANIVLYALTR